jgi:hypothetical protein
VPSNKEVYFTRDGVAEAMEYLVPYLPAETSLHQEVPEEFDWSSADLVIQISDGGGPGVRDTVLEDQVLWVEVSHPDSVVASHWVRVIYALLRAWQTGATGVYWSRTHQRPAYQRDSVTGRPFYSLAVELTFKAIPTTIAPTA